MKFSHALLLLIALISLMSNISASAALDTLAAFVMYLHSYSVLAPFVKHPAFVRILRLIFTPTPTTPNTNALPYSPSILLHLFVIVQACLKKSQTLENILLGETFRHCQAVIEFALGSARKLAIQLLQTTLPWVHAWIVRIVSCGLILSDSVTCGAIRFTLILASLDNKVSMAFLVYCPMGTMYYANLPRRFSLVVNELGANRRTPPPRTALRCHLEVSRMHCFANRAFLSWAIVTLVLWEPYWETAMIGVVMMVKTLYVKYSLRKITPVIPLEAYIRASEDYPHSYLYAILALRVAHVRALETEQEDRFHLALRRLAERGAINLTQVDPLLINAMRGLNQCIKMADAKDDLEAVLIDYLVVFDYNVLVYQPGDAEIAERAEFLDGEIMHDIILATMRGPPADPLPID